MKVFLFLLLTTVILCSCSSGYFANKSFTKKNTKWISSDPAVWYQVDSTGTQLDGEFTWDNAAIEIHIGTIYGSVFDIYKYSGIGGISQSDELIGGYISSTSNTKLVVKVDKVNKDNLPGFTAKTITFIRQDNQTSAVTS